MNLLDSYKLQRNVKTSEDLFGIVEPPEHQCSEIDKIIKVIKSVQALSRNTSRLDEDVLRSALDDVYNEIYDLERDVEDIRKACEGIREWGQGWKDLSKKLIEKKQLSIEELV